MGKFIITKRTNGEFQFVLNAGNGETILVSEGYASKQGCMAGVESVKRNASDEGNYQKKTSANAKYFFKLTASNGQVIGSSQMYESAQGRDTGIESVKRNAESVVDDQS